MPSKKFPYRAAFVACAGGHMHPQNPCQYGCLGCKKCVETCPFGAIKIGKRGAAIVEEETCMACGKCVRVCPRKLIRIHECANFVAVRCSNHQMGKEAGEVCASSCIGCGLCERICPAQAIHVADHLARIKEKYCLSCGMCATRCPRHVPVDLRGILTEI